MEMKMSNRKNQIEHGARSGHGAEGMSKAQRRRIMAVMRLAHRVLGIRRARLGLGPLGLAGVTAACVVFQANVASAALVSACTGVSLPRSVVTDILNPIVSPLSLLVPGLPAVWSGIAAGSPITLNVLDTSGNVVSPSADCDTVADTFSLKNPKGISIGGNKITGLGNGTAASAGEMNSIAFGNGAATNAAALNSVAIGPNAAIGAGGTNSVALGNGASATTANSVVLGNASKDRAATTETGVTLGGNAYIFAGQGSAANGVVSVGSAGKERQVINVAAGKIASDSTDAVNGSQLFATNTAVNTLSTTVTNLGNDALKWNTALGAYSAAHGASPTSKITNVTAGTLNAASTDAVNGSQLYATNQTINNIQNGGGIKYFRASSALADSDPAGTNSVAIGPRALASGKESIALGTNDSNLSSSIVTEASGNDSIAIGRSARATNTLSLALGDNAITAGDSGVAIGNVATASGQYGTAVGNRAKANGKQSTALGSGSSANAGATALGTDAVAVGINSIAINGGPGFFGGANAKGDSSIAIGGVSGTKVTTASAQYAIAFGYGAQATAAADTSIAIGNAATTSASKTVAIGNAAKAGGAQAIAMGDGAQATGAQSISIGTGNVVSGDNSGAIGDPTTITGSGTYTVGNNNGTVSANNAGAFGNDNTLTGDSSRIVGNGNSVTTVDTFVVGNGVTTTQDNSVVLGNGSSDRAATTETGVTLNGTPYTFAGQGSAANGVVSVGSADKERQVINVAAGRVASDSTDAVNGSQLFATNTAVEALGDDALKWDTALGAYSAAHGVAPASKITNVAAGDVNATSTDAVNGSQLFAIAGDTSNTYITNNGTGVKYVRTNDTGLVPDDAHASASGATAVGYNAQASGVASAALGYGSVASGHNSTAVGVLSEASGQDSAAVGSSNKASGTFSSALGSYNAASGDESTAMGTANAASGKGSSALGNYNGAGGDYSSAVGYGSVASGDESTAVGFANKASGKGSSALGSYNEASGDVGTALGSYNTASGLNGSALGNYNTASGEEAMAVGTANRASGLKGSALGNYNAADGEYSTSVGYLNVANGDRSVAVGTVNRASGAGSSALGTFNEASGKISTALGNYNAARGDYSAAVGNGNVATGDYSAALGNGNFATGDYSAAVGYKAIASAADSLALGRDSVAGNAGDVALGSGSVTAVAIGTSGTTIGGTLYAFAGTNPLSTVSVGDAGAERTVTNVAAGRLNAGSTDAVNGSQLFATNTAVNTLSTTVTNLANDALLWDPAANGGAGAYNANHGGTGPNKITNVAAGDLSATSTDAVNGSQLFSATAAATTEVAAGTNVGVTKTSDPTDGHAIYTVDADGASVSAGSTAVKVTAGAKDANNVTDYAVDLSDATKTKLDNAVQYDDASHDVVTLGGAGGTKITNVKDGDLSASSTDAVNGSQLFATNQVVNNLANDALLWDSSLGAYNANHGGTGPNKITNVAAGDLSATSTDAVNGSQLFAAAAAATSEVAAGTNVAGVVKTTGADGHAIYTVNANGAKVSAGSTAVDVASTGPDANNVTDYAVDLSAATKTKLDNAVQYDDASHGIVTLGGAGGTKITNVADGTDPNDAVNVSQLGTAVAGAKTHYYSVNDGGTAQANYNNDGATGLNAVAAGPNAKAQAKNAVALGAHATAAAQNSTAVGQQTVAVGAQSVAVGTYAQAATDGSVAVGNTVVAQGNESVAVGAYNTAVGDLSTAMGVNNSAQGAESVAVGAFNNATGVEATALGVQNTASGDFSTAVGNRSEASGLVSLAVGYGASAAADFSTALGYGSVAGNAGDVALGSGSVTAVAIGTSGTTIGGTLYAFAGTNPLSTVSVGDAGAERTITNVAAGRLNVGSTDAVNGSQLFATNTAVNTLSTTVTDLSNDALKWDPAANGGAGAYSANHGGAGPNKITNVAAGDLSATSTDAVNGSQLFSVAAAATTEVVAGTNVGVTRTTDPTDGHAIYTVDADGASVSAGSTAVKVTAGAKDANNVTDYAVDLSDATKEKLDNAVQYDGASHDTVTLGGAGGTKITNVKEGDLSAGSTDAVNGSQLFATNQVVNSLVNDSLLWDSALGAYSANHGGTGPNRISNVANGVAPNDAVNVSQLNAAAAAAATEVKAGTNVASVDKTTDSDGHAIYTVNANGSKVSAGSTAVSVTPTGPDADNVTDYKVDLSDATKEKLDNAVQYDGPAHDTVTLDGAGGTKITNVKDGDVSAGSTDAVNGSQLFATNQTVTNLDNRVTNVEGDVTKILNGTAGLVQQNGGAPGNGDLTVGKDTGGTVVDFTGTDGARKLTGVADGDVSAASKDAVNGSQLYAVQQTAGAGWNISAQGANETNVAPGGKVDLKNTDGNIVVSKTTGSNDVNFDLAPTVNVDTAVNVGGAAGSSLTADGLTTNGGTGPSVKSSGIDAAGLKITNVKAGSDPNDAVNVSQLTGALDGLGGGATVNPDGTVTGPTYNIAGNTYNNVGDALAAQDKLAVKYVPDASGNPTNTVKLTGDGTGSPVAITNVAAGVNDTDAVNYSQIKNNISYDTNPDGSRGNSLTLVGGAVGPVTIHNVAAGVLDSDAANVGQIKQARQDAFDYTDMKVTDLKNALSGEARGGIASAMAAAGLRYDDRPGKASVAAALGGFKGSTSVAAGLGYTTEEGDWRLNGAVGYSFNSRDISWNAGLSFTFN